MQHWQQDEYEPRNRPDDAALYDLYERAIFAYVRLYTPSREDAEDITLEVFTAALENDNLSALQAANVWHGCAVSPITSLLMGIEARCQRVWSPRNIRA